VPDGLLFGLGLMFLEYGLEVLRLRRLGHLRQRAQDFFPAKQMSLSVS
jgi:hypothetical protein